MSQRWTQARTTAGSLPRVAHTLGLLRTRPHPKRVRTITLNQAAVRLSERRPPSHTGFNCLSAALLGVLAACAPPMTLHGGYCAPPSSPALPWVEAGRAAPNASREERMAALLGVRALLLQPPAARSVEARQRALERVVRANFEIAATAAELACEAERAAQAAALLEQRADSQIQGFTLASIAAATLTGIAGVLLSVQNASDAAQIAAGVAGGAVTAGLGIASLHVAPTVRFEHPRNLLGDIWRGPARSSTYPAIVWAYFTQPEFSNLQRSAIRERLVARWARLEVGSRAPQATELLFGPGGEYDVGALRARAAMLEAVKAEVSLENQELAALTALLSQ